MIRKPSLASTPGFVFSLLLALAAPIVLAAPQQESGKTRAPFAGDARLEKRVTLEYAKIPLSEALAEVTRQTGVKLTALDRAADEPVALVVKEQPAKEVLRQIAELCGYWWSRRTTADDGRRTTDDRKSRPGAVVGGPSSVVGSYRYEIYQDLRSRSEEAAILSGARRAVLATLQSEMARHRRYAGLSPEELKKRVEAGEAAMARMMGQGGGASMSFGGSGDQREGMHDWQAARNMSQPLGRILLGMLERLTPAQWQTLMDGEPITYSTDPKAGEQRLAADVATSLRGTKPISPIPAGVAQSLGPDVREQIRKVEEKSAEEWAQAKGYRIDIQMTLSMGAQPFGMIRVGPQPLSATPGLSALNGLNLFGMPELNPNAPKETPEARKARLAADPALAKKGKLPPAEPGGTSFMPFMQRTGETLRRISQGYSVQFVADAYTAGSISMGAPPAATEGDGEPLFELLDRIFGFQRDWTRDGDFIRLRSRTWAFDRNVEIPSRQMRQWAEAWKARDGWDLDQLAAIVAALRPEQIMTFEMAAQEYGIPSNGQLFMLLMSADALRLYARLYPAQRQALISGKPLTLGTLSPAQQSYALDMARGRGRSIVQMFMGPPPWRSRRDLARATLTLQGRPAVGMGFGGAPGGPRVGVTVRSGGPPVQAAPAPAPAAPAAPPRVMAIFELRYPEGRPETFVVPGVLPPGTALPEPPAKDAEKR